MKKVFSLILAVVMVASLASVALAAGADKNAYITTDVAKNVQFAAGYETDLKYLDTRAFHDVSERNGGNLIFGKEYYYPIIANTELTDTNIFSKIGYAISAKQIGSLKVTADWKEGGEYVESVGIKTVYVTSDTNNEAINRNIYVIYVKTTGASSDEESIVGTITVAGTPGSGSKKRPEKVETKIAFDQTISNETIDLMNLTPGADLPKIDVGTIYSFNDGTLEFSANTKTMKNVKFKLDDVGEFVFDGDVKATLDSKVDKTITISYNTNDVADVVAANPDAALMFYSIECNFKESAEVTIEPIDPEGTNYLYQILNSGATKNLTDAYSVDDEQFILNQRKLTGTYIVSDMPLVF